MKEATADNIKNQSMEIPDSKEKHSKMSNSYNPEESKITAKEHVNLNA